MFNLIPREIAFFEMFQKGAHNMIEGSRLLKNMMEDFRNPVEQARRIKDIEHIGDGITHDIALKLNQTFITPLDREDIHGLASVLDDILDLVEAVADRFVVFKVAKPTETAIKLANILYQSAVAVGAGIDQLGKPHADVSQYFVLVNSLENEADRITRDVISKLFEEEKDPIAVIKWKEIYENFEEGTDRCEDVANILERIALKHI
ncbi:MAG: phosphate transport regulator [Nitrospirae bacterium 13_1_40CM_4_62_6]|nr:MAG: phosphate transport regulator [Nitrospirae bacterium 13_1_40CM_4_62_6]